MDALKPAPVSPSDADRLRHAFTRADRGGDAFTRADRGERSDARTVEMQGDAVVLRDGARETVVAHPNAHGVPARPTLSADGRRLAFVRTQADGTSRLEVSRAATGPLGGVRRLMSSTVFSAWPAIVAGEVSDDGHEVAYLTNGAFVHVRALDRQGHDASLRLPQLEGVPQVAQDLEYLNDGRLAVETRSGMILVSQGDAFARVPRAEIDPEGDAALRQRLAARLPALTDAELQDVFARFGTAAVEAVASPDGQAVLLQVAVGDDRVRNVVLDRRSHHEADLGESVVTRPSWSADSERVCVGDRTVSMSSLFSAWDRDLGQDALRQRQEAVGVVEHENGYVIMNGIRVPRRPVGEA